MKDGTAVTIRTASLGLLTKVAPGAAERVSGALGAVDRTSEQVRRLFGLPSPVWQPPKTWTRFTTQEGSRLADELHRQGLVTIPGFFDQSQLTCVRAALDAGFARIPESGLEFRPSQKYYASVQPLTLCPEFAEAAIDPDLLNLAASYFRRTPFLTEADFRRVLPLDMAEHERQNEKFGKGHSSSHWHYDTHGRELKVMIYLTDVGPEDQNFVFLLGSHRGFRSAKYEKSRLNDQQVEAMGHEMLECFASAGTAVVFDSNGIHRLRRRNTTRNRDSVTFNYHPGRLCHHVALAIHPDSLARRRAEFERFAKLAGSQ